MGKFYGAIGYVESVKTAPSVWTPRAIEKMYSGDIIKNVSRQGSEDINTNVHLDNRFSLIADRYAYQHFHKIRYIKWLGVKWEVASVEVVHPRLLITIKGVYNEQQKT